MASEPGADTVDERLRKRAAVRARMADPSFEARTPGYCNDGLEAALELWREEGADLQRQLAEAERERDEIRHEAAARGWGYLYEGDGGGTGTAEPFELTRDLNNAMATALIKSGEPVEIDGIVRSAPPIDEGSETDG